MPLSLQEQLKKSGLVDDKKAKQIKRAKRKEEKLARQEAEGKLSKKGGKPANTHRDAELARMRAEQIAKDRQLNADKNAKAQQNALNAQIKQLIDANKIPLGHSSGGAAGKSTIAAAGGEEKKYSFADGKVIKQIWVSQQQVDQLGRGSLVIVKHSGSYALVPAIVADKIAQRDAAVIVFQAEKNSASQEDDPYADFQIPDDLDW